MSRIIQRTLALAATLLLGGAVACTDPTVAPTSTASGENFFNDIRSYNSYLAKIYAGLAVSGQQGPAGAPDISGIDEGFSQYLRLYWEAQELPTDEAVIAWNDVGLPEMNTQIWASSNSFVVAMYYRIYFQAAMANEFLRQTTDAKLAERGHNSPTIRAQIKQNRAEARFLRALSYWHGMDMFGSIPLVKEDFPIGTQPPPQATRQEMYDFLVSELNDIRDQLPIAGVAGYGRATNIAAAMLLAHVYLNAEVYTGTPHYDDARTAAEYVIAGPYTLDPNYLRMFRTDNDKSPEIIFPIRQDGKKTETYGGVTFLVHAACGGSMQAGDYGIDFTWGGLRLKKEAFLRYAPNDPRRSYFYTTGQDTSVGAISNFNEGIAAPKFQNVSSTGVAGQHSTFTDTDFPMFRLADAYLIYAEAVARGAGGTTAQAVNYVNALRQRAYGNASGNITAAELTPQFVLDERGRELLWEGYRRTDLIRFGQFTGGTYLWEWKGGAQAGTATDGYRDLYPLPASELIANPNLAQNTGY